MKVRWSETALTEIDEIFSYIQARNRSAASAIVKRIEALADLLGEFPEVGHLTDQPDVRLISVVRYPFLIFYTINDATNETVILHVRHGAREYP